MARIAMACIALLGLLVVACGTSKVEVDDAAGTGEIAEIAAGDAADVCGTAETVEPLDAELPETDGPTDAAAENAADSLDICQPDCEGKECGNDACGGICGECGSDMICHPDNQCGLVDCPSLLENAMAVRLGPMYLSPDNEPGNALDLDMDGLPDNGFPGMLASVLPMVEEFTEPLELSDFMEMDLSAIGDDPHPLLVMDNFNTDGIPFTLTFHYGLLPADDAECDYSSQECSHLVDPDLFLNGSCTGKLVLDNAVVQGSILTAGGATYDTWWVKTPGRLYIPGSFQAYMLQLRADVEVSEAGVHLTNGVLGFAFSFQQFVYRGACYAMMPDNPLSCDLLPPIEDPYYGLYDTDYGVSAAVQFSGHPAVVVGICQPECTGKPSDVPDGCGGICE